MNKRIKVGIGFLTLAVIVSGAYYLINSNANSDQSSNAENGQVFVGGDIHTLTAIGNRLYVTGHEGAGLSTDQGRSWSAISSLDNSDVMGWAQSSTGYLVGGHPGLMRSTDDGLTFSKVMPFRNVTDIHSMGAYGKIAYLGSPQIGLLASSDGGVSWELRNSQVGQGFMGSMLVDPTNSKRVIAPDMTSGLVVSEDSGLTWQSLGGPSGAMSVAWNPNKTDEIAAIGMSGGGMSKDGGKIWSNLALPQGASAIAYSTDGSELYVAVLLGDKAQIYSSKDQGKTWSNSALPVSGATKSATHSDSGDMDSNMPGMSHVDSASPKRPISIVLGTFGLGSSTVIIWAAILRRKERESARLKKVEKAARGLNK